MILPSKASMIGGAVALTAALVVSWQLYRAGYNAGFAKAEQACAAERELAATEQRVVEERVRTIVRTVTVNTANADKAREAAAAAMRMELDRHATETSKFDAVCLDADGVRLYNAAGNPPTSGTPTGATPTGVSDGVASVEEGK